jgi:hypothetical protein
MHVPAKLNQGTALNVEMRWAKEGTVKAMLLFPLPSREG